MNEHDGQMLGLEEGDEVRLISEHGTAAAEVRLTSLVAEGTVAVPWGGSAHGGGRYAKGWGPGVEALGNGYRGVLGFPTVAGMRVRIEKARGGTV
jgi:anaerobic selenocysteine-containing dehydrogenase